jgi:acetolactate synthase-1/2/3 large subunit
MTIRVADWLLARLADEGIHHIFMLPGGGAMYLNDALACEPRVNAVPCHHEQAAAIAAEAAGRTGNAGNPGFGVAMVTTGPGATNAITPVAGAWIDSVPMLVLSGQAKRPDRLGGRPIRQGGVQEVDIVPIVSPITKYAVTLDDPQSVRVHLEKALHLMKTGRPGPVWIDVPLDVQAAPIDPATLPGWTPPADATAPMPDLAPVLTMLAEAKRPLILAGHGVRLAGAADAFRQLVDHLQVPAVLTWNALDLLPYDHPLNIGRPGVVAARAANFAVQNCDLLISIGARLDMIVTAYNPKRLRPRRAQGGGGRGRQRAGRQDRDGHRPTPGDGRRRLHPNPAGRRHTRRHHRLARPLHPLEGPLHAERTAASLPPSGPIGHAHFVEALSDAAPADTLIATGSSGLAVEFFYAGFRNKPGQRTFLTSGLGAMGYGLPAAIGACLGNDRKPMLAVESDGSLQLNLQELATLTGLQLPICLFIMNNGGYASIRNTQRNYFNGRYVGSGPASGLFMPDLEKLAAVYGLPYLRIDDCAELAAALARAQALPRPCLIDVRLIPEESLQPKCAAIPRADGSIISMPLEDMSPLLPLETLEAEMIVPLLPASLDAPRPA